MKRLITATFLICLAFAFAAKAQEPESQSFEALLEADATADLGVAWQYFKTRKAYIASLSRVEVTIQAHPGFSKFDEVLYLAGMSSYYLYKGKGSQKIDLENMSELDQERFQKDKLKDDAIGYLSRLVEEHPESKYVKQAKKTLKEIEKKE